MATETEKAGHSIDVDIPCSQCGDNLRGLEAGGRCPECGGDVRTSVERWERRQLGLRGINLQWLRSVQRGLGLIVVSNTLLLAVVFLANFSRRGDGIVEGREWVLYVSTGLWV